MSEIEYLYGPSREDVQKHLAEGWEIVSVISEITHLYPNYSRDEKAFVVESQLVFILKRLKP